MPGAFRKLDFRAKSNYIVTMRAHLVRIGNSRGIRIPKPIIDQCHLTGAIEIEVSGDGLVIHAVKRPRKNWTQAFKEMAVQMDDKLLDNSHPSTWDEQEWEWR